MPSERQRILELALESLENKKKQIDDEIEDLTRQLRQGKTDATVPVIRLSAGARRQSRFTKEERARRSARMRAYWEKWRKGKARRK